MEFPVGGGRLGLLNQHFTGYKPAFTLSEVLISLVIIGVIAAIAVPVLISNYQEQALKSSLKKNYSVLKQMLDRYYIENGESLYSSTVSAGGGKNAIIKFFNVLKDGGYYKLVDQTDTQTYRTYNNKNYVWMYYFDDGQFVLNDGSLIMIQNDNVNDYNYGQFYISVDVNGFGKKPNRLGKDLFMFQLTESGDLLPMGAKGTYFYSADDKYCSKTSSHNMNGAACTYKALQE